jgi:hypothetical protein
MLPTLTKVCKFMKGKISQATGFCLEKILNSLKRLVVIHYN